MLIPQFLLVMFVPMIIRSPPSTYTTNIAIRLMTADIMRISTFKTLAIYRPRHILNVTYYNGIVNQITKKRQMRIVELPTAGGSGGKPLPFLCGFFLFFCWQGLCRLYRAGDTVVIGAIDIFSHTVHTDILLYNYVDCSQV